MDSLSFTANLVDSLAWPLAVLITAVVFLWLFKSPLTGLISRITSISHNGTRIDMAQVQELAQEAAQGVEPIEIDYRAQNAISNAPRAAVIEAWLRFEWEAKGILENRGIDRALRSPAQIIQELRKQDLLSGNLAEIVVDLREIRNRAAHEIDMYIDSDSARQYVEAVELAIAILRSNAD